MSFTYDERRQKILALTPEERLRQQLLAKMIEELAYPQALLTVEKELEELPHLKGVKNLPKRRCDIVCYIRRQEILVPLLLIECKAEILDQNTISQVIGYNYYVKAPFIALVSAKKAFYGWIKEGKYQFQEGFPSYGELIAHE